MASPQHVARATLKAIEAIAARLARIEAHLGLAPDGDGADGPPDPAAMNAALEGDPVPPPVKAPSPTPRSRDR